ncbi:hypothetical protein BDF14DRAFT_1982258 [Spinellus fusiger]|nr:hypothetical protein BDF14DRAFT_1982258 [Spinellus fusiger]
MYILSIARCCHLSVRYYSQGPFSGKIKGIPFTQTRQAADKRVDRFHGHNFFSLKFDSLNAPSQVFFPFWVVSATVKAEIAQAQVGRNTQITTYNHKTGRNSTEYYVDWVSVHEHPTFRRHYNPQGHPGLQVYASYKYRRGLVNAICHGQALQQAEPWTADLLERLTEGKRLNRTRQVDPYTIYPSTALRLAKDYLQAKEEFYADEYLKETYNADSTRLVQVNISLHDVKMSPIYYPTYVYSMTYLERHLRTFVHGCDLSIGGMRAYNWNRVALATSITMGPIIGMLGCVQCDIGLGTYGSILVNVFIPTTITSLLTMYYPILSLRLRDMLRNKEIQQQQKDPKYWDTDWIGAYDAYEQNQRYKAWQSERRQHYGSSREEYSSKNDPKNYYQVLGLDSSATLYDIQGAFRGMAMKHHPDRFTDAREKSKANKKFQEITNAYSVLRDIKKKREYDRTGGN